MHLTNKTIAHLLSAGVVLSAASLVGCGPTVFQGQSGLKIVGELPPPPPPPPPKPKPKLKKPARVKIVENKIVINEKIQFEVNKAVIKEVSFDLLNEIVKTIQDNAQVKKIRIEGHASSEGPDDYNMRLSDKRANAVMAYFVGHGVAQDRLVAKGYGKTKPIADNDTEEGREKNRRVEFNILEQNVTRTKVPIKDEKTEAPGKGAASAATKK